MTLPVDQGLQDGISLLDLLLVLHALFRGIFEAGKPHLLVGEDEAINRSSQHLRARLLQDDLQPVLQLHLAA